MCFFLNSNNLMFPSTFERIFAIARVNHYLGNLFHFLSYWFIIALTNWFVYNINLNLFEYLEFE